LNTFEQKIIEVCCNFYQEIIDYRKFTVEYFNFRHLRNKNNLRGNNIAVVSLTPNSIPIIEGFLTKKYEFRVGTH